MATKTTKTTTASKAKKTTAPKKVSAVVTSGLDGKVFNYSVSEKLLFQVIHVYRDNLHQNTSKAKTRGELTKTTKKMYKQKGTGNARHGSKMSPTFVGGGVAFGPTGIKPKNLKLNKKMKALALAGILSKYAKDQNVELISTPSVDTPSSKIVKKMFTKDKTAIIVDKESTSFISSVKNLKNINLIEAAKLNAYDVANFRHIVLTPKAHENIVTRLTPLLKNIVSK